MTAKKPAAKAADSNPTRIGAHVENVSIVNTSAANEHTRAAVEALAAASTAHAQALSDIAKALQGSPASIGAGISLSNVHS